MALRQSTLCLGFLLALAYADEVCDLGLPCPGPVKYYEELNCKPVYGSPGDCCAARYDCSHLEGRSADKCYANGKAYSIGEQLKDEDRATPCDVGCKCVGEPGVTASFNCAVVDCYGKSAKDGCFLKQKPGECCPSEEICPKKGEEKVTCKVDGQTYHESQSFSPESKPGLTCTCLEGFNGDLVEPFCKKTPCGTELRHSADIYNKCVPVYYDNQPPETSCSFASRCPNDKDKVIKKSSPEISADVKCTFGKLTLDINDELNQGTSYDSICVKCVCEVPPILTCRQLSDAECDMSNQNLDY